MRESSVAKFLFSVFLPLIIIAINAQELRISSSDLIKLAAGFLSLLF